MTTLAARPVEDPDQLALIADDWSPLLKPFADAFRDACWEDACENFLWVNPNRVRARLLNHPGYNARQLSALWASSCSRTGFLVKTDQRVPISGEGSKGNGNKDVPLRRWLGGTS